MSAPNCPGGFSIPREIIETRIQKSRISRNPRTNEKIDVPKKKTLQFKMSKKWFNELNNE